MTRHRLRPLRRAATQVILAAIAKSDGTRKGVRDQVFGGSGITIPADQLDDRQGVRRSTRRPAT